MANSGKLRVAIIGAGIAGLATAIALQKHDGIDIQIYERASELRDIGAKIALGPNGMRALERLGVLEALDDDPAFRNRSGYPMLYRHWKTNEAVSVDRHHGDLEYSHQTSRFYRARLQQALLAHVEPGTIHLRKAFKSVSSSLDTDELLITFEDGSETVADVLLGADGIQSAVRRFFIPTSAPKWIGWVAFRSVFGAKLVEHIPGVLDEAYHWWGPDRTFFSSRLGKNLFTIVGGNYTDPNAPDAPWKDATWNSDGDLGVLKSYYKDWHPMIRQMIDASRYVRMYSNTFASSLETWVHGDGRVTFPETRHMLMEERLLLEDRWPWTMHGRFLGLYSRPSHRTLQSHQEVPSTKPCGFMKQQESHTSIEFSLLYIRIMRLRYSD